MLKTGSIEIYFHGLNDVQYQCIVNNNWGSVFKDVVVA
jgi:hypothetical protein